MCLLKLNNVTNTRGDKNAQFSTCQTYNSQIRLQIHKRLLHRPTTGYGNFLEKLAIQTHLSPLGDTVACNEWL